MKGYEIMTNTEQKNSKPPIPPVLLHEGAEENIFNAVSEAAKVIPFYQIEEILTNILHQVRAQAENERTRARQTYKQQMEEYEKESEKEGEEDGSGT